MSEIYIKYTISGLVFGLYQHRGFHTIHLEAVAKNIDKIMLHLFSTVSGVGPNGRPGMTHMGFMNFSIVHRL